MSIPFYLWLHLAGIGLVLLSLGALVQARETSGKLYTIAHGIGLLVVLVSGFGLLARYGIHWPWPGWVVLKLVVWVVLGGAATLIRKQTGLARPLWWAVWVVFVLAAFLAIHKPF